jgi:hypothetical protein
MVKKAESDEPTGRDNFLNYLRDGLNSGGS